MFQFIQVMFTQTHVRKQTVTFTNNKLIGTDCIYSS